MNKAIELTSGDREAAHGDFQTNLKTVSAVTNELLKSRGVKLLPEDIALILAVVKLTRATGGGHYNADDYIDGCCYVAAMGEAALDRIIEHGGD